MVAVCSAMRWRAEWKERKWRMAKFTEALAASTLEQVKTLARVAWGGGAGVEREWRVGRGRDREGGGYGGVGRREVLVVGMHCRVAGYLYKILYR